MERVVEDLLKIWREEDGEILVQGMDNRDRFWTQP